MKKVYYLVIICCLLLVLSGCQKGFADKVGEVDGKNIQTNTQLLKCNMEIDDGIPETEKSDRTVEIFYKDEAILKISMILGFKMKDTFTSEAVTVVEHNVIEKQKKIYNNYAPIVVGSNRKGTTSFEVVIEVDYNKLTEQEKEELDFHFLGDYAEDRRVYENSGYTCE